MAGGWLDITEEGGSRRVALSSGLTRIGAGGDIPLAAAGTDQIHVWDEPPRAIFVGEGVQPTHNGSGLEEATLRPGDRIEWHGVLFVYGGDAAAQDQAVLEEISVAAPAPQPAALGATPVAAPAGMSAGEERVWKRLQAGMLVELDLADRVTAKRWQDAVMRGEFDPDRCASDILARSGARPDEPKILERSGRLLRDLLMQPLLRGSRGASRRAREVSKRGLAMVISQGTAFLIYTLIVLAIFLALRIRGMDFNLMFDRMLFRD
ncbi:MAG: hypothetical protein O7B99_05060 [Planctomycetota bacterium]|nr:hypothetical protein [Planctomycetota bacterium]